MPDQPVDAWTAFLQWLSTILIPDWGGLIGMLPILLIVGVVGPGLSFLALYWIYVRLRSRRGHVRTAEPEPQAIAATADGSYAYPANAPYCPTHHLVYPPTMSNCQVDREELLVRCPVDVSVRVASQQLNVIDEVRSAPVIRAPPNQHAEVIGSVIRQHFAQRRPAARFAASLALTSCPVPLDRFADHRKTCRLESCEFLS